LPVISDGTDQSIWPKLKSPPNHIVYIELDTQLKRVRETPRKIMRYDNANWENIRTDLSDTMRTIKAKYISYKFSI
jgi:hypothetical protein